MSRLSRQVIAGNVWNAGMQEKVQTTFWLTLFLLVIATVSSGSLAAAVVSALDKTVYSRVDGETISAEEYRNTVRSLTRQTFYHGKIPEDQVSGVAKRAGTELIMRRLLLQEAQRRNLAPDETWVEAQLTYYDQRYRSNPHWEKNRERLLPGLRHGLQDESRLQQLKETVAAIADPDEKQLKTYYRQHLEKFTEPARSRLSVILLGVDASASVATWDAARTEAKALVDKLREGADFAGMARLHSADPSAGKGGDMGYLHRGMLAEPAQKAVDALRIGQISAPVALLQGVAIFQLDDIKKEVQKDFDSVNERARDLWKREQREQAWQSQLEKLWTRALIEVNEGYPLPTLADKTISGEATISQ